MAKRDGDVSKPAEGAGLSQDDADALERGDVASVNRDADPRLAMMDKARKTRAEEMGATVEEKLEGEEDDAAGDSGRARFHPDEQAKIRQEKEDDDGDDGAGAGEGAEGAAGGTSSAGKGEEGDAGAAAAALADDAVVEITVNGKAEKVTWGEAKKRLQVSTATEETLAQAKETREAANRELEAARAARKIVGEPEVVKQPAGPTAEEKRAQDIADAEAGKRAARKKHGEALRYGTDEEIATAEEALDKAESHLDKLRFEAVRPAQAEPQRDSLLEREVVDTNRGTTSYIEKFGEDQKDRLFRAAAAMHLRDETIADLTKIGASESILSNLSDVQLGEHHFRARSRGLVRSVDKLLEAAGSKAREELKKRSSTGTPPANAREERLNRKIDTPSQPKVAAGRAPDAEAAKPKTNADLVAEARRRRGQA